RVEGKESVRRNLSRRRRRAVAALENPQVPPGVVARERGRALLDLVRPRVAWGQIQVIARGVGPGDEQDGPEDEDAGGPRGEPPLLDRGELSPRCSRRRRRRLSFPRGAGRARGRGLLLRARR